LNANPERHPLKAKPQMIRPMHLLTGAAVSVWVSAVFAQAQTDAPQLANPAAVYCVQSGGTYKTVREDAGERGICVLPDGREVDAWQHFRGSKGLFQRR
jgi:uncharacterized protein